MFWINCITIVKFFSLLLFKMVQCPCLKRNWDSLETGFHSNPTHFFSFLLFYFSFFHTSFSFGAMRSVSLWCCPRWKSGCPSVTSLSCWCCMVDSCNTWLCPSAVRSFSRAMQSSHQRGPPSIYYRPYLLPGSPPINLPTVALHTHSMKKNLVWHHNNLWTQKNGFIYKITTYHFTFPRNSFIPFSKHIYK